jgi:hypothetical protein
MPVMVVASRFFIARYAPIEEIPVRTDQNLKEGKPVSYCAVITLKLRRAYRDALVKHADRAAYRPRNDRMKRMGLSAGQKYFRKSSDRCYRFEVSAGCPRKRLRRLKGERSSAAWRNFIWQVVVERDARVITSRLGLIVPEPDVTDQQLHIADGIP